MLGFSNLLKSNFGDSAALLTSPLEPRLKPGRDAATAPPPPELFDTPVGERRVPREKDPRKPNYEMIKDARKGILSGFLRSGKIFRASDFVGIVNPKTAIITLQENYEFETRFLAAINDQPTPQFPLSSLVPFKKVAGKGDEDEKTLRSLFYIALAPDELPSFHFWTKPGDLDPVTAGEPMDWGKHFDENPPSPTTTAKITMLEDQRKKSVQRGVEGQQTQNNQPLEFLNRDNDINSQRQGKEPTRGQPGDDFGSVPRTDVAPILAQPPLDPEVLLQFNRGGMYLRELTHKALYAMACWLIENEEEEEEDEADRGTTETGGILLDILEPGKNLREEKIASVSRASNRHFQENIKPALGRPYVRYRIRSTRFQSSWNIDSDFDSGGVGDLKYDLKLVRPNVGYCYCSANWHIPKKLHLNSRRFGKALRFLFDWESSAYPKSNHLSLDIPGHGAFNLDRDSDLVVGANIQLIFAELSGTPVKPDSRPAEIFIRDIVEDVTDASDFLGTSPPRQGNFKYEKGPEEVLDVLQPPSGAVSHVDQGSLIALDIPNRRPSDILGNIITGPPLGRSPLEATEIRGGPDLPSIHPRLLTNSETNKLRERLSIAEASLVETDDLQEQLRIAEEKLSEMTGLNERLKTSEDRAKLTSSCPFCSQDWAGVTKQQQQDHLKLHQRDLVHQPAPQPCPQPHCTSSLGENQRESTYEAIAEHLRLHLEEEHTEDGICECQHCHANMYALTAEQQEEHEKMHLDDRKTQEERDRLYEQIRGLEETSEKPNRGLDQDENLEDIVKKRDQLQRQVRDLENTAMERDQLLQQVYHLQDAANERDQLQEDLVKMTEERDSLQDRALELEERLKDASGLDGGTQTKESEPEIEMDEDHKQQSQPEGPKKLRYCNVCMKSVDKLSFNAKTKHADKCKTNVSDFLLLTPAGAKAEREKQNNSHVVVRPQSQEAAEEEGKVPSTGRKKKQKASGKAAPLESQQDEAEDVNNLQQAEASKATSRKAPKRKHDIFKPPREDESDEEVESPRKKPKLKAKAAKANQKEAAPTRRSTRHKDVYEPSEEVEEDGDREETYDEPSSSAKGGKRKTRPVATTTASKKAKTKK